MPRSRPATTGYARLSQADLDRGGSDSDSDYDPLLASAASLQPASEPQNLGSAVAPRPHSSMAADKPVLPPLARHASSSHQHHQQRRQQRRARARAAGVDLKAINARLERWADEIAAKFRRRRRRGDGEDDDDDERLEIPHSVCRAPDGERHV